MIMPGDGPAILGRQWFQQLGISVTMPVTATTAIHSGIKTPSDKGLRSKVAVAKDQSQSAGGSQLKAPKKPLAGTNTKVQSKSEVVHQVTSQCNWQNSYRGYPQAKPHPLNSSVASSNYIQSKLYTKRLHTSFCSNCMPAQSQFIM
jgi:hypothetical protein